ncbi:tyrosine-protein phosphatase [Aquisediminimonas sediminicola]|uniref:tyrosine-protein phosphatase n=1 Tax=Alteraquisediminimonas sediminicola TaxID=2676787 RepID=UPI001C8EF24E|nr:tyrosine-protein phosphatase [Aquisediminimonas sediminicola]
MAGDSPKSIFTSTPNFRDIGGLVGEAGQRLRPGRVYRSGSLAELSNDEWRDFSRLGVRLFVDLRSPGERATHIIPWPDPAPEICPLEVLPDVRAGGTAIMQQLLDDADGSWTRALLLRNYASMPSDFAPSVGRFFSALTDKGDAAAIVACTAGQDRTGFVIALLLSALGVAEDQVMADYMLSYPHLDTDRVARFIAKTLGGEDERAPSAAAMQSLRVAPEYMAAAMEALRRDYGDVGRYLARHGVTDDVMQRVKSDIFE